MRAIAITLASIGLSVFLVGCSPQSDSNHPTRIKPDGYTRVFNVKTPNGPYQCITWSSGSAGGMDCDRLQ